MSGKKKDQPEVEELSDKDLEKVEGGFATDSIAVNINNDFQTTDEVSVNINNDFEIDPLAVNINNDF